MYTASLVIDDTWMTLASVVQARAGHAAAVVNGKLYVFGGNTPGGRTELVEIYSPASNSWGCAADLHCALEQCAAVAL